MSRIYTTINDNNNVFQGFTPLGVERDRSTVAGVKMEDPNRQKRLNKYRKMAEKEISLFGENENE